MQLLHAVPDRAEHPAHLAVAAFVEHELDVGA
jgi:hypothetical protein